MAPGSCQFCERPTLARGWCNAHYKRWRKTGDPLGSVPRKRPTVCVNGHPFDEVNTYLRRDGKRSCRTCARYFSRRWHHKERIAGRIFTQASAEWKAQYQREVRAGIRVPVKRSNSERQVSATILDFVTLDRGWWTTAALAHRLGLNPNSVGKTLGRLKERGLLEVRDRNYREWKAVPQEV